MAAAGVVQTTGATPNQGVTSLNAEPATGFAGFKERFEALTQKQKLAIAVGVPALIATAIALLLWMSVPQYRPLFNNVSDKDGGEIVAALTAMNVPYKYAANGTTITVPEDKLYDTRLALASQGLPKGNVEGFEAMDSQPLGVTQFQEQVNYQRGLEGELAKSIMSLNAVESARVHLAMPKPSIFVRDEEKPSASVVVKLYRGRSLTRSQVDGIVHLISSSLPNLSPKAVSVVDQSGNLLTTNDNSDSSLSTTQLNYQKGREKDYQDAIVNILAPLFGRNNVRATVSADLDFSSVERKQENYAPNNRGDATVRSMQRSAVKDVASGNPSGIPGVLANTPPDGAKAQIGGDPNKLNSNGSALDQNTERSDETYNYEVNKETVFMKEQSGGVKRLTSAVVVNYKTITNENGATREVPLTPAELDQVSSLVKQAIGFDAKRGDKLDVVNQPFNKESGPELSFWQQPETHDLLRTVGTPLAVALVVGFLVFGLLRPMLKPLMPRDPLEGPELMPGQPNDTPLLGVAGGEEDDDDFYSSLSSKHGRLEREREVRLEAVRSLAAENPELIAAVVKNWLAGIPMGQEALAIEKNK